MLDTVRADSKFGRGGLAELDSCLLLKKST